MDDAMHDRERVADGSTAAWDGELVRKWLDSRLRSARFDQAAADRSGYPARNDYDDAAEEWVCRSLQAGSDTDDPSGFARKIKALLAQDEYQVTGIHDDRRFDRTVRAILRRTARMTKANEGFANTRRYQN